MVNAVILQVPRNARVVVVGNVLGESSIDQVVAFNKELDLRFAMNYTSAEFGKTLNDIADGRIDASRALSAVMRPEEANAAFIALADAEQHAKIVLCYDD